MAKSGLGTLHERLADIGDAERSLVRRDDVVVDDRGQVDSDIVLGHADLAGHFSDLNLDVDGGQVLAERVDLDEAGVDGTLETSEFGDEADLALVNGLEGVGAAETAGDGAQEANGLTQGVD